MATLDELAFLENPMLGVALALFSVINIVAGAAFAGLYLRFQSGGGVPVSVLLIGIAFVVQGAFTLGYLRGWWSRLGERIPRLFVAGESVAALAGVLGTLQGILYNLSPVNGDQEFGPLMAAALMGTHAIVGLSYAACHGTLSVNGRA